MAEWGEEEEEGEEEQEQAQEEEQEEEEEVAIVRIARRATKAGTIKDGEALIITTIKIGHDGETRTGEEDIKVVEVIGEEDGATRAEAIGEGDHTKVEEASNRTRRDADMKEHRD